MFLPLLSHLEGEVWLQSHPLSSAQASRMISKAGKWEDDATQYHPRQHTTPKSTAQDGLPGRVSDTAAAKPQAAINKGKELLAAWLLAVWLMALDRRTYTRWETQQSIWRWLRASPPETKTHGEANPTSCKMHLPLSACGIAVGRHWRTEGPDPLFKTVRYQLTLQSSNKHWSTQVGSAQVSDIWKG